MMKLKQFIVLSFCFTLNSALLNYTNYNFLGFGERRDLVGRGGGGWGSDSGLMEKIGSLLTFLAFGVFLLNLLLNALLLGSTIFGLIQGIGGITTTGTGTGTGGTGIITTTGTATGGVAGALSLSTEGLTATGSGGGTGGLAVGSPRRKRSLDLNIKPSTIANSMAKELMDMIEVITRADEECIPQLLCVTNKRATVAGNGFQFLMPLCSMGASYFGERSRLRNKFSLYVDAIFDGVRELNCKDKYRDCQ